VSRRVFLDTNILIYADDADAGRKREIARAVLADAFRTGTAALSTQVLSEFFVISTRKLGVPPEAAQKKVELLATLDVFRPDADDLLAAIDLHRLHRLSYWDALVIRSAQIAGCHVVLTEDLSDGARYGQVVVENPFREGSAPRTPRARSARRKE
jgi:predicted nucleic acid-binding protein